MPRLLQLPLNPFFPAVYNVVFLYVQSLPLAVVSVVALVLLLSPAVLLADEIAVQSEKLQQLQERIGAIKNDIDSMRGEHAALQETLKKTEKEIGSVSAELRQLDMDTANVHRKIQDLRDERSDEDVRLDAMRASLAQEFQLAYMTGRQERIKLLLSQQEPSAVGRLLVYHGYFARARADRMQDLLASLQRMNDIEQALLAKQDEIVRLREQQADKSLRLAGEQDRRRQVLARLQVEMNSKTTELTTLEQDQQRLQKLVQSLTLALQDIPPDAGQYTSLRELKGKLRWPVAGRITRSFGEIEQQGTLVTRGVYIDTRAGTEVQAIASGRIAFSDWLRGFGLLLIIDHGDGYMSLYGQNRSLYKEVGEWVAHGETIAAAGDSGGQASAGLYLELRKDGKPFNPRPWFKGKPVPLQAVR